MNKLKYLLLFTGVLMLSLNIYSGQLQNKESALPESLKFNLGDSVVLELNWIPPGKFLLGSTEHQRNWATGEIGNIDPEEVKREGDSPTETWIENGFWIGKYEITIAQFNQFINQTNYSTTAQKDGEIYTYNWELDKWGMVRNRDWNNPNFPVTDDSPAVSISWHDANEFCAWLNRKERENIPDEYEFRLPTEAEWEYACTGGRTNTMFWWGNDFSDCKMRINGAGPDKFGKDAKNRSLKRGFPYKDGFPFVAPTGAFGKRGENDFGLSDMLGNVYEWTLDNFNPNGATSKVYLDNSTQRIIKGGAFTSPPGYYRIAYRSSWNENTCCAQIGFRVVLAPAIKLNNL